MSDAQSQFARQIVQLFDDCGRMARHYQTAPADVLTAMVVLCAGLCDGRATFDSLGNGKGRRIHLPVTLVTPEMPLWLDRMLFAIRESQSLLTGESTQPMMRADALAPNRRKLLRKIREMERFGTLFQQELEDMRFMAYARNHYARHLELHDVAVDGGLLPANSKLLSNSLLVLAAGDQAFHKLYRRVGTPRSIWNRIWHPKAPRIHFMGIGSEVFLRQQHRHQPLEVSKYGWMVPVASGALLPDNHVVRFPVLDHVMRCAALDRWVGIPRSLQPGEATRWQLEELVERQAAEVAGLPSFLQPLAMPSAPLVWQVVAAAHRIAMFLSGPSQQEVGEFLGLGMQIADHLHQHHLYWLRLTFPAMGDTPLEADALRVLDHLRAGPLSARDLMRKSRNRTRADIDRLLAQLEQACVAVPVEGKWQITPAPRTKLAEMAIGSSAAPPDRPPAP